MNNLGNSLYNKTLTDGLLSGEQAVSGDNDLTIARASGLTTELAAKQDAIAGAQFSNTLATLGSPFVALGNHFGGLGGHLSHQDCPGKSQMRPQTKNGQKKSVRWTPPFPDFDTYL